MSACSWSTVRTAATDITEHREADRWARFTTLLDPRQRIKSKPLTMRQATALRIPYTYSLRAPFQNRAVSLVAGLHQPLESPLGFRIRSALMVKVERQHPVCAVPMGAFGPIPPHGSSA